MATLRISQETHKGLKDLSRLLGRSMGQLVSDMVAEAQAESKDLELAPPPDLPGEAWKEIPGFPDYDVSNMGLVRSRKHGVQLLQPVFTHRGRYLSVSLFQNGKQTKRTIHSLVLEAFIGPRPDGLEICHNDGIRTDNMLANLRYDTPSANAQDQYR